MRGELVAIDLETTGLDPLNDAIIEVGALRFRDGEVLDEFSTLIDPDRPIPHLITNITGIRTQDVAGAPRIASIIPRLREFIGDAPIIGHSVGLVIAFLNRQRILQNNPRIATYDLASTLLPCSLRYSLASPASDMALDRSN